MRSIVLFILLATAGASPCRGIDLLLDIEGVLLRRIRWEHLVAAGEGGISVTSSDRTSYYVLAPRAVPFLRWLSENPHFRLSLVSHEPAESNVPLVYGIRVESRSLAALARGRIHSREELVDSRDLPNAHQPEDRFFHGRLKKPIALAERLPDWSADLTVLIDDEPGVVRRGEERNFLFSETFATYSAFLSAMSDPGRVFQAVNDVNHLIRVAGILALSLQAHQAGGDFLDAMRRIQWVDGIYGKPNHDPDIYARGLLELSGYGVTRLAEDDDLCSYVLNP